MIIEGNIKVKCSLLFWTLETLRFYKALEVETSDKHKLNNKGCIEKQKLGTIF